MNLFTEIREGFRISSSALRANKLRSALTMLGIVIGIVTVSLMGTAIEGLNGAFRRSVSSIGTDVLFVQRFGWLNTDPWWKVRNRREITLTHARQVERQMTMARAVAPLKFGFIPVKYRERTAGNVQVTGTTDQYQVTQSITVAQGRFFGASESTGGRPVCVLGADVADNLFNGQTPIGKRVKLGESNFEVIGVVARQGKILGYAFDNQVFIPILQFLMHFNPNPDVEIQVKVAPTVPLDEAREEVRGLMRKLRRLDPAAPDDFAINQQDQIIKRFNELGGNIATIGLFITGLSLFVGGIGIMNIMFVSVAERTREIGIRKAIGAKRRTILLQFLIEASMICLLGGLIGLAITFPISLAISRFLPTSLSMLVVLVAIGVSLLTGVISGFFPAYRAARMNPVDALRNE